MSRIKPPAGVQDGLRTVCTVREMYLCRETRVDITSDVRCVDQEPAGIFGRAAASRHGGTVDACVAPLIARRAVVARPCGVASAALGFLSSRECGRICHGFS